MIYAAICKQQKQDSKRFWQFQKRLLVMPVLDKQIQSDIVDFS